MAILVTNRSWNTPVLKTNAVVDKVRQGDGRAFEELYALYRMPVYSLCLRLTKDALDAQDLTQEVFLQVHRKVSCFRGEAAFGSWLYRVTTNLTRMHLRKQRRKKEIPFDAIESRDHSQMYVWRPATRARRDPVERIALLRALGGLTERRRSVILLHDFNGLTHKEVAARLGVTANTSKSQLCLAHRTLRDILCSAAISNS